MDSLVVPSLLQVAQKILVQVARETYVVRGFVPVGLCLLSSKRTHIFLQLECYNYCSSVVAVNSI